MNKYDSLFLILIREGDTEYFCPSCKQLRLNLAKSTECMNCGCKDIIVGKPGELDKDKLIKQSAD